jgi:hypothetical protein
MARNASKSGELTPIERILDVGDASLLDVLDHVLNKGVMATGDVTLGVAGIDLIYVRLSALLCAADRVMPARRPSKRRATPAPSRARAPRKRR